MKRHRYRYHILLRPFRLNFLSTDTFNTEKKLILQLIQSTNIKAHSLLSYINDSISLHVKTITHAT